MTELTGTSISYTRADDLRAVRTFVATRAAALGLSADRVESLILAVSELATNTLQHTTGGGRVRVWAENGQIVDGGQAAALKLGRDMPPADAVRGRGLTIVEQVCDAVEVSVVAEGTRVRVRLNL
jgi:serine/threonine-protein kinase RsbW